MTDSEQSFDSQIAALLAGETKPIETKLGATTISNGSLPAPTGDNPNFHRASELTNLAVSDDRLAEAHRQEIVQEMRKLLPDSDSLFLDRVVSAIFLIQGFVDVSGAEVGKSVAECEQIQRLVTSFITNQRQKLDKPPLHFSYSKPQIGEMTSTWVITVTLAPENHLSNSQRVPIEGLM